MSLSEFEALLKTVTDAVFERQAPEGLTRCIVWHRYNLTPIVGDDSRVLELPRVQLDLYWQQRLDTLLDDVTALLSYYRLPFDLQDITWDDERMLSRAILQLTVV